MVFLQNP